MSVELHHIYFLEKDFNQFKEFLEANNYSKIAILVDENSYLSCLTFIQNLVGSFTLIKIKSGEEQKNLQTCIQIWQVLTENQFDRKGLLINLGGGVIGDMGGFCAATYKRGIDFVQIPTTLLSQVDASVGGKLGIDFDGYKNHIGVFNEPKAVFIFSHFLKTLPEAELRSGFAEIIKHCLISDVNAWETILKINLEKLCSFDFEVEAIIKHSVKIKTNVVENDPTERGLRKILNFGHTLGHAIETFFLPTPDKLLHGEAIAIGMICEAYLAHKLGMLNEVELLQITRYLTEIYGKVNIQSEDFPLILDHTLQDKKNSYGIVKFSLLNGIGKCGYDYECTKEDMLLSLSFYTNAR